MYHLAGEQVIGFLTRIWIKENAIDVY